MKFSVQYTLHFMYGLNVSKINNCSILQIKVILDHETWVEWWICNFVYVLFLFPFSLKSGGLWHVLALVLIFVSFRLHGDMLSFLFYFIHLNVDWNKHTVFLTFLDIGLVIFLFVPFSHILGCFILSSLFIWSLYYYL